MDTYKNRLTITSELTDGFRSFLADLGYKPNYLRQLVRTISIVQDVLDAAEFSELFHSYDVKKYLTIRIEDKFEYNPFRKIVSGVRKFQEYLILRGEIAAPIAPERIENTDKIYLALSEFLTKEKAYSSRNSRSILRTYRKIKDFTVHLELEDVTKLNELILLDFLTGRSVTKSFATTLRIILKFLYREGYVEKNLAHLIMSCKRQKVSIKRYLLPDEINRILKVIPKSSTLEKRSYAMILLMARLGLRVCETRRIKLTDIDWVNARVRISGKSGKVAHLPFTQDVGDAILDYLKSSVRSDSEYVFLSTRPPYQRFLSTKALVGVLAKAYRASAVSCPTSVIRTNVFRHSFATEKLSNGVPILAVRDLLRHESVDVTMIYAKHNVASLRTFVMPWPRRAK